MLRLWRKGFKLSILDRVIAGNEDLVLVTLDAFQRNITQCLKTEYSLAKVSGMVFKSKKSQPALKEQG